MSHCVSCVRQGHLPAVFADSLVCPQVGGTRPRHLRDLLPSCRHLHVRPLPLHGRRLDPDYGRPARPRHLLDAYAGSESVGLYAVDAAWTSATSAVLHLDNGKISYAGRNWKPSSGLEPETPSLPCAAKRLPWVATRCGSSCLSGFRGCPICHRLPLVAPAWLHKRSIARRPIPDGTSALRVAARGSGACEHAERSHLAGLVGDWLALQRNDEGRCAQPIDATRLARDSGWLPMSLGRRRRHSL
jgi:hypothetical protein